MKWFLQHKDYGLGNFCNCLPVIESLNLPIYFESDYIKQIYENCHFGVEVLNERPKEKELFGSYDINREKDRPDKTYLMCKHLELEQVPKQYIAVIVNGCANPAKRHTKDPGNEIYQKIVDDLKQTGYITVFIGNSEDKSNFKVACDYEIIDNPVESALRIAECAVIIANDTGWHHYGAIYEKKGFILWKDTDHIKNNALNKNYTISHKTAWWHDYLRWISNI